VHFAFTDQQLEFRDAVRQILAKECTIADRRAAYDAPSARSARWSTLARLGVTGITVPEAMGGLGLGLVDLVPLLEEAGSVALPEPLAMTTGVAATLLVDLESAGAGAGGGGVPDSGGRWRWARAMIIVNDKVSGRARRRFKKPPDLMLSVRKDHRIQDKTDQCQPNS